MHDFQKGNWESKFSYTPKKTNSQRDTNKYIYQPCGTIDEPPNRTYTENPKSRSNKPHLRVLDDPYIYVPQERKGHRVPTPCKTRCRSSCGHHSCPDRRDKLLDLIKCKIKDLECLLSNTNYCACGECKEEDDIICWDTTEAPTTHACGTTEAPTTHTCDTTEACIRCIIETDFGHWMWEIGDAYPSPLELLFSPIPASVCSPSPPAYEPEHICPNLCPYINGSGSLPSAWGVTLSSGYVCSSGSGLCGSGIPYTYAPDVLHHSPPGYDLGNGSIIRLLGCSSGSGCDSSGTCGSGCNWRGSGIRLRWEVEYSSGMQCFIGGDTFKIGTVQMKNMAGPWHPTPHPTWAGSNIPQREYLVHCVHLSETTDPDIQN